MPYSVKMLVARIIMGLIMGSELVAMEPPLSDKYESSIITTKKRKVEDEPQLVISSSTQSSSPTDDDLHSAINVLEACFFSLSEKQQKAVMETGWTPIYALCLKKSPIHAKIARLCDDYDLTAKTRCYDQGLENKKGLYITRVDGEDMQKFNAKFWQSFFDTLKTEEGASIRRLGLGFIKLGDKFMTSLIESLPHLPHLNGIVLAHCEINDDSLCTLATALSTNRSLFELGIEGDKIGSKATLALIEALGKNDTL